MVYPRYPHVPKIGHWFSGPLLAAALLPHVAKYRGKVDVVLGAWAYPDGWASIVLARMLGVPAVIKLFGSDMNVVAKLTGPRLMLRGMLPRAERVVAVSRRLGEEAVSLGVDPARVDLVMDGVNPALFSVDDRQAARRALGLDPERRLLLFVGSVQQEKGVGELLDAFDELAAGDDDISLAIVGDGPMRATCQERARRHQGRLVVAGPRPLEEVARWLAACDVFTLPSWSEGTPNVILEALTCGRRVVATDVGGIPDLIVDDLLGTLIPRKDAASLAGALRVAARTGYDPREVAAHGGRGDWNESACDLRKVLANAIAGRVS